MSVFISDKDMANRVQNKIRTFSLNLTAFFFSRLILAGCQQEGTSTYPKYGIKG